MQFKHVIWVFAGILVVGAAGLFIVAESGDSVARWMGGAGILFSIFAFIWDSFKHHDLKKERGQEREERRREKEQDRREREEQKKERVEIKANFQITGEGVQFIVSIYNPCSFDIHIKPVELQLAGFGIQTSGFSADNAILKLPLVSAITLTIPTSGENGSETCRVGTTNEVELRSHRDVTFHLPPSPFVKAVAKTTADKVWLSVRSSAGEIARLPGEDALPVLQEYWNLMELQLKKEAKSS